MSDLRGRTSEALTRGIDATPARNQHPFFADGAGELRNFGHAGEGLFPTRHFPSVDGGRTKNRRVFHCRSKSGARRMKGERAGIAPTLVSLRVHFTLHSPRRGMQYRTADRSDGSPRFRARRAERDRTANDIIRAAAMFSAAIRPPRPADAAPGHFFPAAETGARFIAFCEPSA